MGVVETRKDLELVSSPSRAVRDLDRHDPVRGRGRVDVGDEHRPVPASAHQRGEVHIGIGDQRKHVHISKNIETA